VIDAQGNRLEIQIRTTEMNEFAELGIAAHWRYKEAGKQNSIADESIASLRQSLAEKDSNEALLEDFRTELFADRVFTLTPDGKLIDLIKGATPLDFAYAVHTEVGHRCRGAKVNHHIVPLTYTLQSGDRVEILTTNVGAPNHNWIDPNLDYLKTSRAIHKVKAWFRKQQQEQNVTAGKNILSVEVNRLGLTTPDHDEIATHFKFSSQENFLAAIGRGDVTTRQLSGFLQIPEEKPEVHEFVSKHKPSNKHSTVIVQGVDNVLTSFAQCCNPVHGDEIIAFISHTKGITIHRRACINLTQLSAKQQTRLLRANWGAPETLLTVPIVIQANDRQGLINDVTRILDQAKINILDALYQRRDDFSALLELTIQINSTDQLSQILGKINQIPDILDARRKLNN
jgi:GTP pyrophosphokinase